MKNIFVQSSPDLLFPQRLDRYIRRHGNILQSVLEKGCRFGKIRVNGKKVLANHRIHVGDEIFLDVDLEETSIPILKKDRAYLDSLIIFEDETFCILNKPHGLAVQGGSGIEHHVDGLLKAAGNYHLVHRLDRDTSGILLVAKTPAMSHYLGTLFKNHKIHKVYHARVHGTPKEGLISAPLLREPDKVVVSSLGKEAKTECKILQKQSDSTLVELIPLTGRTHQLRVHMAYLGTPILGDKKYGFKDSQRRLYLHAHEIRFPLQNSKIMQFRAETEWA